MSTTATATRTFTATDAILVGPVSTRKGYRLHLAESGRAHCGAGWGHILCTVTLAPAHEAQVCRRCIRAIHAEVEHASAAAANAGANAYSETTVRDLTVLGEALETPDEHAAAHARRDDLAARIRADLLASGVLVGMAATVEVAPAVRAVAQRQYDLAARFAVAA